MRLRRDGETHGAVMGRPKNLMQVGGISTVEKEQESPVLVLPSSIQLNQEPVRLSTCDEIIVEADTLTRHESMRRGINALTQSSPEERGHTRFRCHQEIR